MVVPTVTVKPDAETRVAASSGGANEKPAPEHCSAEDTASFRRRQLEKINGCSRPVDIQFLRIDGMLRFDVPAVRFRQVATP